MAEKHFLDYDGLKIIIEKLKSKFITSGGSTDFGTIKADNGTVTLTSAVGKKTAYSGEIFNNYVGGNTATGEASHAEGSGTTASANGAHAEGINTIASGATSHAEGYNTEASLAYSHAEGNGSKATANSAHAEGNGSKAQAEGAHAEGKATASGVDSHAENAGVATGAGSHAEGDSTSAYGIGSHAEGNSTHANGVYSHAEGTSTLSNGSYSHAEGNNCYANGINSHAEGQSCTVSNDTYASHVEGIGTVASSSYQHVSGKYNVSDTLEQYAVIVGNGGSSSTNSNAFTIDWNGNIVCGKTDTDGKISSYGTVNGVDVSTYASTNWIDLNLNSNNVESGSIQAKTIGDMIFIRGKDVVLKSDMKVAPQAPFVLATTTKFDFNDYRTCGLVNFGAGGLYPAQLTAQQYQSENILDGFAIGNLIPAGTTCYDFMLVGAK